MNKVLSSSGYSTRTEFIREAIRKKLDEIERGKMIKEFFSYRGKAGKKTTYKENRKTREIASKELFEELEKRFS
jgi:metal-responsive CopG/Arc/MetJ family transcriptional regulator